MVVVFHAANRATTTSDISWRQQKRKIRRDGSKKAAINTHDWHLKLHVLLFWLNLCIREDLLTVIKHFHLQIALIRSLPFTWTCTWQDERVHAPVVKQTRCCNGKGSYWGCSTQRRQSVAGGSSAERTSVERCSGCPETQTCRRTGASCRMKRERERKKEVHKTKTATLAFSGGRKWAPCKRCCSADGSSCCRSAAGSFSSSPPESAAFPAQL